MEKQPLNRIKVMLAERMLTNKQLAEMLGKDPQQYRSGHQYITTNFREFD